MDDNYTMLNESRTDIYNYLYSLFYNVVTKNVYAMNEPQELTQSDVNDGFIVIRVGSLYDESEFDMQAYAHARVYVEAYVPPMTRGRLDVAKYKFFEDSINGVIKNAMERSDGVYWVQNDSVLSMDSNELANPDNPYYMFVKSFVVEIGENQEQQNNDNVDNGNGN